MLYILMDICFSGPPAFLLVANLVDVHQINPDNTGAQTLVEESRGIIIALDYDPVQLNVRRIHIMFHMFFFFWFYN